MTTIDPHPTCDVCGAPARYVRCKIVCTVLGCPGVRTCSDP